MLRLVFPSDPTVLGSPAAPSLSHPKCVWEGSGFGAASSSHPGGPQSMERKEWSPPPVADVLSSPIAGAVVGQSRRWRGCGVQTQVQATFRGTTWVFGFLFGLRLRVKTAMMLFLSRANPLQTVGLLCSLRFAIIMTILKLFSFYYYFLLVAVHANLPTQGIACLKGSYSQKLDTGADKHLRDI